MNVLVVDDEAVARNAVAHVLRNAGWEVSTACNGIEALEVIESGHCQLVVCDREMPLMDGIELCHAVRQRRTGGYVYFLMLTSHDSPKDMIQGLGAGADDYIAKPFNPGELLMRVNTGRRIVALETRDLAVFMMAKLAESRDPDSGEHLERVRNYARSLAQQLYKKQEFASELDQCFIDLIYETSPLHDIGKVAIPDNILLKPGKLSDAEFGIMSGHTVEGAKTLQAALDQYPNARFLQMARDIAISHHEKFDGTGYPHGLAGEAIPLCGRIVAVADVYDALTSKRVYKDAYSHDVAKAIIVEGAGQHFDPRVVDAFLELESNFQTIRSRFADRLEVESCEESSGLVGSPSVTWSPVETQSCGHGW